MVFCKSKIHDVTNLMLKLINNIEKKHMEFSIWRDKCWLDDNIKFVSQILITTQIDE